MTLSFDHLGIAFTGRTPARKIVELAQIADEQRLGSLWMTESLFFRGALTTMAAVASATEHIQMGPGVVSMFSRHPALMAMEAANIDELSSGRFFLGLGATPFVPIENFKSLRPLRAFREYIEIFNRMIDQNIVDYEGEIFQVVKAEHFSPTGSSLNFMPYRPRIPVYVGTSGPMSLRLAGQIADGIILTNLSNPGYIRWATDLLHEGAERAGRDPAELKVCAFITISVDEDSELAREATKEILAIYYHNIGEVAASTVGTPDESLQLLGVTAEHYHALDAALNSGGVEAAMKLIGDEEIERSAVAGTPAECVEKLVSFLDAGLNVPIAFHTIGPDKKRAIGLLGQQVVPELKAAVAEVNQVAQS